MARSNILTRPTGFPLPEPDAYNKEGESHPSPSQIGEDFLNLRRILDVYPNLKDGKLVGPDVVGFAEKEGKAIFEK